MIVTKITPVTNKRFEVYLDEEFAFTVYKGELSSYTIKENEPLDQNSYNTIKYEVLPKRAKLRSMNLLKTKDYTEEQLRKKLQDGGYPQDIIEEAVEYVKGYHYIDDERYCRCYIEEQAGSKSRQKIIQDLRNRGISKELIEEGIKRAEELELFSEEKLISRYIEKRHYDKEHADYKEKCKMYAYLAGKGFKSEQISKYL